MASTTRGTDPITVSGDTGTVPGMRRSADVAATEEEQLTGSDLGRVPGRRVLRRSGVYSRRTRLPMGRLGAADEGSTPEVDGQDGSAPPDEVTDELRLPLGGPTLPGFPIRPRIRYGREQLRVDVDGRAPTMTVSGSVPGGLYARRLTWIARVGRTAAGTWAGPISYRDGTSGLLPHSRVDVALHPTAPGGKRTAVATFSGGRAKPVTKEFTFARGHFRTVNFEFDTVSDATAATTYDTTSHPNRPAGLPAETLTIESAYRHMGVRVTRSGDSVIDISAAGANALWSDIEMHDAMQVNWSRWADVPQWAVWVLFARQHETGPSLGGIMFDDIGAAQRQGCAIFSESFVSNAPAGDPAPAAWVQRMLFWTAIHEIGHAFNLAHSWQKSLGTGWVPLTDEVEARSYMNYPYRVAAAPGMTPEQSFFSDFAFRFSDDELVFLRHAPRQLVQQGNAAWFDHHAFEEARAEIAAPLALEARLHRSPRFEFMEPVIVELKLKNTSVSPVVVDRQLLESDRVSLVVTRRGIEPRVIRPYARRCYAPDDAVLMPGESLYASVHVSSDVYGFAIDEPGEYAVYAMLDLEETDVLAAPLGLRILPPDSRDEERMAASVFSDEVGRTLAFGGSRVLTAATDTLGEVAERFTDRPIARHARMALGTVAARPGKVLRPAAPGRIAVSVEEAEPDTAMAQLGAAYDDLHAAADTFGHIEVTANVLEYAEVVRAAGDPTAAAGIAGELADAIEARGVKQSVVAGTRQKAADLAT